MTPQSLENFHHVQFVQQQHTYIVLYIRRRRVFNDIAKYCFVADERQQQSSDM